MRWFFLGGGAWGWGWGGGASLRRGEPGDFAEERGDVRDAGVELPAPVALVVVGAQGVQEVFHFGIAGVVTWASGGRRCRGAERAGEGEERASNGGAWRGRAVCAMGCVGHATTRHDADLRVFRVEVPALLLNVLLRVRWPGRRGSKAGRGQDHSWPRCSRLGC